MSYKFSLLFTLYFVFFQSCDAFFPFSDLNLVLGSCPRKSGEPSLNPSVLNGKWYTHWTSGKFSPWNYLPCQSHEFKINTNGQPSTLESRFKTPGLIPINLTMPAVMEPASNGQFDATYYNSILGNFRQKFAFLGVDPEGVAVVWTCIDFKLFHLESTMTMLKSANPFDDQVTEPVREKMEALMKKNIMKKESISQVDQSDCQNAYFSF